MLFSEVNVMLIPMQVSVCNLWHFGVSINMLFVYSLP